MHGRYPDYDVLEQAGHWDRGHPQDGARSVHAVPEIRFFTTREAATLGQLCDLLTAQDSEPRIPVINFIDEKYFKGELDGYQYDDLPDDRDVWRLVAQGLDDEASERAGAQSFAAADASAQSAIVADFAEGKLADGIWAQLNLKRAFSLIMRVTVACFYSHPWAWNEIGFGGPAYPRGYSRFGSPQLQNAERETWEGREAFDRDPVTDRREPPPTR